MSKQETRSLRAPVKAEPDYKLSGVAAATGVISHPIAPNVVETISKGTFTRRLKEVASRKHNVYALMNHDSNKVLGATKSGTLALSEAENGSLVFLLQLDRNQQQARDLWSAVSRKDLDACSFAFSVNGSAGEEWSTTPDPENPRRTIQLRTLKDVDLFDISIVAQPCYPAGTSVNARSELRYNYAPAERTLAAPSLDFLKKEMLRQRDEIFRSWPKEWGFGEILDERGNVVDFRLVTAEERDEINRRKAQFIGKLIAAEQRAQEECECDCAECEEGNCGDCSNSKCTDDACEHDED